MRVAYVTNIMTPYRVPMWEHLRREVGELHVITLALTEKNRTWKVQENITFVHHCLQSPGVFVPQLDGALYWGGGMRAKLESIAPTHVLMDGYAQLPYIAAIRWARRRGLPTAQWFRGHKMSSRFRSGPVAWARRYLLRQADAWAVPGELTRRYLVDMGIHERRIVEAPNAVETEVFAAPAVPAREGPMRLLYVGQLLERKGIDVLLQAFLTVPAGKAVLRIVGAGPLEGALRQMAGGRGDVEFAGATRTAEQTALHYAWADVAAMPSFREVWGLVANEALAAGCYLLSSKYAAATVDLVERAPAAVGRSIDPLAGAAALRDVLLETCRGLPAIRAARPAIREWGGRFTVAATAAGLARALRAAGDT